MMTEEEFKAKLAENLGLLMDPTAGCYVTMATNCVGCWVRRSCGNNNVCSRLPHELKAAPSATICPSKAFFQAYLEGKVVLHNGEWVEVVDE